MKRDTFKIVHSLPGRLRIVLNNAGTQSSAVWEWLRLQPGIVAVTWNNITASVVITYNSQVWTEKEILFVLEKVWGPYTADITGEIVNRNLWFSLLAGVAIVAGSVLRLSLIHI